MPSTPIVMFLVQRHHEHEGTEFEGLCATLEEAKRDVEESLKLRVTSGWEQKASDLGTERWILRYAEHADIYSGTEMWVDRIEVRAEQSAHEKAARKALWLSHGHDGLYGDDGEMQCVSCGKHGVVDYKRAPLDQIVEAALTALRVRKFDLPDVAVYRGEDQEEVARFTNLSVEHPFCWDFPPGNYTLHSSVPLWVLQCDRAEVGAALPTITWMYNNAIKLQEGYLFQFSVLDEKLGLFYLMRGRS